MSISRLSGAGSALGVAGLVTVVALSSCSWITGSDDDEYRIRVDSIAVPASVGASDTLRVTLYGYVGSSGCYSLDRIDALRRNHSLELTVWGRHRTGGNIVCTQAVVFLREPYAIPPPFADPFSVVIRQPDGSHLTVAVPDVE
jgi:hypothetical protein